jgi:hypothetical protein
MAAYSADKNLERSFFKKLMNKKATLIRQNLKRRHFQLMFIINKMVNKIAKHIGDGSKYLNLFSDKNDVGPSVQHRDCYRWRFESLQLIQ